MFETVIFDWDGTLANTKDVIVKAFQQVLQENGCEIYDDYIAKRIGIGARNILKEVFMITKTPFSDELIDKLVKEKCKLNENWTRNITLFNGARTLLDFLKGQVKIGLATMNNRTVIEKVLNEQQVRNYFDVVITFDDVEKPKPYPEIFLKCAMKLQSPPERCLVVEDSIFGVQAAKKANMKCIALLSGGYSRKELKKETPDLIVKSIGELQKIVQFIMNPDFEKIT